LEPPVPIEEIVEFQFDLNIIPFPNLKRNSQIDGFLAFDCSAIYVDQYQLEHHPSRYRFTLAHELSHLILHKDIYREASIETLDDYIRWHEELDEYVRSAYEFQAMNLAGRILLPKTTFLSTCERHLSPLRAQIPEEADPSLVCELLGAKVAPEFAVSDEVTFRRLWRDGLCEDLGLGRRT